VRVLVHPYYLHSPQLLDLLVQLVVGCNGSPCNPCPFLPPPSIHLRWSYPGPTGVNGGPLACIAPSIHLCWSYPGPMGVNGGSSLAHGQSTVGVAGNRAVGVLCSLPLFPSLARSPAAGWTSFRALLKVSGLRLDLFRTFQFHFHLGCMATYSSRRIQSRHQKYRRRCGKLCCAPALSFAALRLLEASRSRISVINLSYFCNLGGRGSPAYLLALVAHQYPTLSVPHGESQNYQVSFHRLNESVKFIYSCRCGHDKCPYPVHKLKDQDAHRKKYHQKEIKTLVYEGN
jgi:hypothetical protein